MEKKEKLRLLSDKPTTPKTKSGSKFGYKDVSSTVVDIIDAAPRPFTIGLFGKWGRGKSTVLEEVRIKIDRRRYTFVKFDVWKYEGDSLRRSFLVDVAGQINTSLNLWDKVKGKKISSREIERKLYNNESEPKTTFKPNTKGLVVSAIAFVIIYLLTRQLEATESLSLAIASLPFLVELIKSIDPTQILQKINVARSPAGSPEQFEKIFKEDILSATRGTLVVAVDNLDRTQSKKTAELLSTIKTFLNSDDADDNVIFLIAADNLAIKQHISNKYQNKSGDNFSADEFLQKFFNVSIDMPELIPTEVSEYTAELLEETNLNIEQRDDVLYLISLFFNKNPREIKQFINNLVAYYTQIKNAHDIYDFDESFLKNNAPFMVFLLIMREKYLNAYTNLKRDIMNGESWSEIKTNKLSSYVVENAPEYADYQDFIAKTRHANPSGNNIATFFSLRTSNTEKMLPGWDIFAGNLESGEVKASLKQIEEFEIKALRQQLIATLNGALGNKARFTILSRTILEIIAKSDRLQNDDGFSSAILEIILGNTREADIEKVFTGETMGASLSNLDKTKDAVRKDFVNQIAGYLKSQLGSLKKGDLKSDSLLVESYATPILKYFANKPSTAISWRPQIQKLLEITSDLPIFSLVADDEKLRELVTESSYNNFLESIDKDLLEDSTITLEIETLAKITNESRMSAFLLKISDILSSVSDHEIRQPILEAVSLKLIEYPDSADEPAQATVQSLTRNLLDTRAGLASKDSLDSMLLLKGIVVISSSSTNNLTNETDTTITNFIKNDEISRVTELIDLVNNTERAHDFDDALKERILDSPLNNYDSLSTLIDESDRAEVLSSIASSIWRGVADVESYISLLSRNETLIPGYDNLLLSSLINAYGEGHNRAEIRRISHHNARTSLKGSLKKPLRDAIKDIENDRQEDAGSQ